MTGLKEDKLGLATTPATKLAKTAVFPLRDQNLLNGIKKFLDYDAQAALSLTATWFGDLNYKDLLRIHFPNEKITSTAIPYKQAFLATYHHNYGIYSNRVKKLFRLFKTGAKNDIAQAKIAPEELVFKDKQGDSCLSLAVKNQYQEVCDYCYEELLVPLYQSQQGSAMPWKDRNNWNLLQWAIKCRQSLEKINELIKVTDINHISFGGFTPLFFAAEAGRLDVVKCLIAQEGIEINGSPYLSERGWRTSLSPLLVAAECGHLPIVEFLAEQKNIDMNASDRFGNTSLYNAAEKGHLAVVKFLIEEKGVPIHQRCVYDKTALHVSAANGRLEVVKYLLAQDSSSINILDSDNRTPLFHAATHGQLDVFIYLFTQPTVDKSCMTVGIAKTEECPPEIVNYLTEQESRSSQSESSIHSSQETYGGQSLGTEITRLNLEATIEEKPFIVSSPSADDNGEQSVLLYRRNLSSTLTKSDLTASSNIYFQILCGVSAVLGLVALIIAFLVLNAATAGTATSIGLAITGGLAFFAGGTGLVLNRCKNLGVHLANKGSALEGMAVV